MLPTQQGFISPDAYRKIKAMSFKAMSQYIRRVYTQGYFQGVAVGSKFIANKVDGSKHVELDESPREVGR